MGPGRRVRRREGAVASCCPAPAARRTGSPRGTRRASPRPCRVGTVAPDRPERPRDSSSGDSPSARPSAHSRSTPPSLRERGSALGTLGFRILDGLLHRPIRTGHRACGRRRNQLACWAKHPRNTSSLGFALQGRHGPRPGGEGSTVDDHGCRHMRAGLRGARGPRSASSDGRARPTRSSRRIRHPRVVRPATAPSPLRGLLYGGTNDPTSGIPSGLGVATRYRVIVTAPTLTAPSSAIDGGAAATGLMGVPSEHHHSGPRAGHQHDGAGTFPVRRRKEVFQ